MKSAYHLAMSLNQAKEASSFALSRKDNMWRKLWKLWSGP